MIKLSDVKIQSDGSITNLIVNGVDMSFKVSEAELSFKGGEIPMLTLKLLVDSSDIQSIAQVAILKKK